MTNETSLRSVNPRGAIEPGLYRINYGRMLLRDLWHYSTGFRSFRVLLAWRKTSHRCSVSRWLPYRINEVRASAQELHPEALAALRNMRSDLPLNLLEICYVMRDPRTVNEHGDAIGASWYLTDGHAVMINLIYMKTPSKSSPGGFREARVTYVTSARAGDRYLVTCNRPQNTQFRPAAMVARVKLADASPNMTLQRHYRRIAGRRDLISGLTTDASIALLERLSDLEYAPRVANGCMERVPAVAGTSATPSS